MLPPPADQPRLRRPALTATGLGCQHDSPRSTRSALPLGTWRWPAPWHSAPRSAPTSAPQVGTTSSRAPPMVLSKAQVPERPRRRSRRAGCPVPSGRDPRASGSMCDTHATRRTGPLIQCPPYKADGAYERPVQLRRPISRSCWTGHEGLCCDRRNIVAEFSPSGRRAHVCLPPTKDTRWFSNIGFTCFATFVIAFVLGC